MIRVYFDWNIFSNIKNKRGKIFFEIQDFLLNNKSSILLPYSPAHLQDLERSYFTSEKGKFETINDLEFLGDITSNHCLCYNHKEQIVSPNVIHPINYFEDVFIKNKEENIFNLDNLFGNDEFGRSLKGLMDTFKLLPTGIDLTMFENIPDEYKIIKDVFKNTFRNNNMGSLLDDIMSMLQNTDEFENVFKKIRSKANNDLKINTDSSKWGEPFMYLDEIFKQNKLNKGFLELANELTQNSKKSVSKFEYFSNYYMQLDMFGYYKDKKVANLIDDATHSFYAAHTDMFVTDDENTYRKSKAIYKQLNLSTDVLYSKDFIKIVRQKKLIGEEKSLADQIGNILDSSFLLLDTLDDELNPVKVYKVEPLLFDYFDRFQFSSYKESIIINFYKKPTNYSEFIFWTELENIVKRFYLELGLDLNLRGEFNSIEKEEFYEGKWSGRYWNWGGIEYFIKYDSFPLRLNFSIKYNKR